MRVPNLDWAPDLFADAADARRDQTDVAEAAADGANWLWLDMANAWSIRAGKPRAHPPATDLSARAA